MYGAIFGDIIGSPFEFDMGDKTKQFELFSEKSYFTDDTVMTIAIGEALMEAGRDASEEDIEKKVTAAMQRWGHKYPDAGYGGRFYQWLHMGDAAKPYGSYGNGSAMRVSAAGWLYDTVDRTRKVAAATARVTHNQMTKEEIKKYVVSEFQYNLDRTLDEIRPNYHHVEDCMHTVPEAIIAFLEGKSYEDAVRNAVSLGGDTDTLAAIAGAMAEAFYGIPIGLVMRAERYLNPEIARVLEKFDKFLGRDPMVETCASDDNRRIKKALDAFYEHGNEENFMLLRDTLISRMREDGQMLTPMRDENASGEGAQKHTKAPKEGFSYNREMHLVVDVVREQSGREWIPMFTDRDELGRGKRGICTNRPIQEVLTYALSDAKISGVVINPFGQSVVLNKELIENLLCTLRQEKRE